MPIKTIRRYSDLRAKGDSSIEERLAMLIKHNKSLDAQIEKLQEHKAKLAEKIQHYLLLL